MTGSEINNDFQVTENQLVEKLAEVQKLAGNDQIRVIELLLAEVVFMEHQYMSSFHRGQKLDFSTLPHFLEESVEHDTQPSQKSPRKNRSSRTKRP